MWKHVTKFTANYQQFFNTFDFITRTPIVFSLKKMGNSTLKLFIKIMRS